MLKKLTACLVALVFLLSLTACGGKTDTPTEPDNTTTAATDSTSTDKDNTTAVDTTAEMFADGDFKDITNETADATITLNGTTASISDTTRGSDGQTVTITQKGIYRVTGKGENVTIQIDDDTQSGNVYLILDNITMTNAGSPCILVSDADKTILQCIGKNTLTATFGNSEDTKDGAIYAKDDLTINGSGDLAVTSDKHGIVCKNDLKITGASLTLKTDAIGLKSGDSLRIGGGAITVSAAHDGVQVSSKENTGVFYMNDGALSITAGYDGIDVAGSVVLGGGTLQVSAGGGAQNTKNDETSQKGIKCDGDLAVTAATVTIDTADDAVNANGNVTINSGTITASSADDGIHADSNITINGGTITVSKALEGFEAQAITINDGTVSVTASDDGMNAAGGSDSASDERGPWGSGATGTLTINGGDVYVNSQGDGLDSNGSLYITGGKTIVEGPTNSGNGALDIGEGGGCVAEITGGTVLAIGSSGMAVNFGSGSLCSALVNCSGDAGTTITVDDGSDFTFTASKPFTSVVYASASMQQGKTYTLTAGSNTATLDFTAGQFYTDVAGMGGFGQGMGGPGGMGGRGGMRGPGQGTEDGTQGTGGNGQAFGGPGGFG